MTKNDYRAVRTLGRFYLPVGGLAYFLLGLLMELPYEAGVLAIALAFSLGVSLFLTMVDSDNFDGALVVDLSDPERDVYSLQLGIPFEDIPGHRVIHLEVKASQE